jgi:hypothetical protein
VSTDLFKVDSDRSHLDSNGRSWNRRRYKYHRTSSPSESADSDPSLDRVTGTAGRSAGSKTLRNLTAAEVQPAAASHGGCSGAAVTAAFC